MPEQLLGYPLNERSTRAFYLRIADEIARGRVESLGARHLTPLQLFESVRQGLLRCAVFPGEDPNYLIENDEDTNKQSFHPDDPRSRVTVHLSTRFAAHENPEDYNLTYKRKKHRPDAISALGLADSQYRNTEWLHRERNDEADAHFAWKHGERASSRKIRKFALPEHQTQLKSVIQYLKILDRLAKSEDGTSAWSGINEKGNTFHQIDELVGLLDIIDTVEKVAAIQFPHIKGYCIYAIPSSEDTKLYSYQFLHDTKHFSDIDHVPWQPVPTPEQSKVIASPEVTPTVPIPDMSVRLMRLREMRRTLAANREFLRRNHPVTTILRARMQSRLASEEDARGLMAKRMRESDDSNNRAEQEILKATRTINQLSRQGLDSLCAAIIPGPDITCTDDELKNALVKLGPLFARMYELPTNARGVLVDRLSHHEYVFMSAKYRTQASSKLFDILADPAAATKLIEGLKQQTDLADLLARDILSDIFSSITSDGHGVVRMHGDPAMHVLNQSRIPSQSNDGELVEALSQVSETLQKSVSDRIKAMREAKAAAEKKAKEEKLAIKRDEIYRTTIRDAYNQTESLFANSVFADQCDKRGIAINTFGSNWTPFRLNRAGSFEHLKHYGKVIAGSAIAAFSTGVAMTLGPPALQPIADALYDRLHPVQPPIVERITATPLAAITATPRITETPLPHQPDFFEILGQNFKLPDSPLINTSARALRGEMTEALPDRINSTMHVRNIGTIIQEPDSLKGKKLISTAVAPPEGIVDRYGLKPFINIKKTSELKLQSLPNDRLVYVSGRIDLVTPLEGYEVKNIYVPTNVSAMSDASGAVYLSQGIDAAFIELAPLPASKQSLGRVREYPDVVGVGYDLPKNWKERALSVNAMLTGDPELQSIHSSLIQSLEENPNNSDEIILKHLNILGAYVDKNKKYSLKTIPNQAGFTKSNTLTFLANNRNTPYYCSVAAFATSGFLESIGVENHVRVNVPVVREGQSIVEKGITHADLVVVLPLSGRSLLVDMTPSSSATDADRRALEDLRTASQVPLDTRSTGQSNVEKKNATSNTPVSRPAQTVPINSTEVSTATPTPIAEPTAIATHAVTPIETPTPIQNRYAIDDVQEKNTNVLDKVAQLEQQDLIDFLNLYKYPLLFGVSSTVLSAYLINRHQRRRTDSGVQAPIEVVKGLEIKADIDKLGAQMDKYSREYGGVERRVMMGIIYKLRSSFTLDNISMINGLLSQWDVHRHGSGTKWLLWHSEGMDFTSYESAAEAFRAIAESDVDFKKYLPQASTTKLLELKRALKTSLATRDQLTPDENFETLWNAAKETLKSEKSSLAELRERVAMLAQIKSEGDFLSVQIANPLVESAHNTEQTAVTGGIELLNRLNPSSQSTLLQLLNFNNS